MANFSYLAQSMAPNILGAFEQGRAQTRQLERERLADDEMRAKIERGNQFRQLAGQAYGAGNRADRQTAVSQAATVDPQAAMALDTQLAGNEEAKNKRLGVWARALLNVPEGPTRQMLYQQMRPEMQSFGINAPEQYTPEVGQMAQAFADMASGQPSSVQAFRSMTTGMSPEDVDRARRIELGLEGRASSGGFGFRTVTLPDGRETLVVTDPRTGGVRQASADEVRAFMGGAAPAAGGAAAGGSQPGGTALTGPTPADLERMKATGKLNAELDIKPQIARRETQEKTGAERQAVFIDEGLRAADAMPTINRAMELLDSVNTGGLSAAQLAATNFFGITGADEGELSNNLGKAVLSQLRATFGAAFTEREGARLAEIEAEFGKSTAVNKRLLGQTKAIVDRAARRGIDAARAAGDEFSAREIEQALNMRMPGSAPPAAPPRTQQPQALSQTQSGAPVRVSSPQEAMSLPSGTQFVTPDGRVKVRP